jgi:hypothetical protein
VDDVAQPILKLSDAKRHASLLSSFLLENSLYFDFNDQCIDFVVMHHFVKFAKPWQSIAL